MPLVDQTPPVVVHLPCSELPKNQTPRIAARFLDDSALFSPQVVYLLTGSSFWQSAPMEWSDADTAFVAALSKATEPFVYFIEVFDENGNGPARAGSPDDPFGVRFVDSPAPACHQLPEPVRIPLQVTLPAAPEQAAGARGSPEGGALFGALELGAAAFVSRPQSALFSTPGAAAAVSLSLAPTPNPAELLNRLSLQLDVGWFGFKQSKAQGDGGAVYASGGVGFAPFGRWRTIAPQLDAHFGFARSGDINGALIDIGVRADMAVAFSRLGLFARYLHLFDRPAAGVLAGDARVVTAGLSLLLDGNAVQYSAAPEAPTPEQLLVDADGGPAANEVVAASAENSDPAGTDPELAPGRPPQRLEIEAAVVLVSDELQGGTVETFATPLPSPPVALAKRKSPVELTPTPRTLTVEPLVFDLRSHRATGQGLALYSEKQASVVSVGALMAMDETRLRASPATKTRRISAEARLADNRTVADVAAQLAAEGGTVVVDGIEISLGRRPGELVIGGITYEIAGLKGALRHHKATGKGLSRGQGQEGGEDGGDEAVMVEGMPVYINGQAVFLTSDGLRSMTKATATATNASELTAALSHRPRVAKSLRREVDADQDGVADARDFCPVAAGDPRSARPGCPAEDREAVLARNAMELSPALAEQDDNETKQDVGSDDEAGSDAAPAKGERPSKKGRPRAASASQTSGELLEELRLRFVYGRTVLRPHEQQRFDEVVTILKTKPGARVRVVGHADHLGSREHNYELSLERAQAIKALLVDSGIEASRIDVAGLGESKPIAPPLSGMSPEAVAARQSNRRVEFVILE